jgi:hypothetical protein
VFDLSIEKLPVELVQQVMGQEKHTEINISFLCSVLKRISLLALLFGLNSLGNPFG